MFKKENKKKKIILMVGNIAILILLSIGNAFAWRGKGRKTFRPNTIKYYKL